MFAIAAIAALDRANAGAVGCRGHPHPLRASDYCPAFIHPFERFSCRQRQAAIAPAPLVSLSSACCRFMLGNGNNRRRARLVAGRRSTDRMVDAAEEAQFDSRLDAHIADIHEWLEGKYREKYRSGQTDLCFEALLVCQKEKVPAPTWLIEALRAEVELALRRSVGWAQLKIAAQEANELRKAEAEQNRAWCMEQGVEVLKHNPTLNSESRLAELIAARAKGHRIRGDRDAGRLWEGLTVADVPAHVDAYVKRRDRSAGTARRELGVLQAAINHAHKRGRITRSVIVELPPCPPSRTKWLTRKEAAKLLWASRKDRKARLYMPLFIVIGIYTGRRREAILSLRWPQIDFKATASISRLMGALSLRNGAVKFPSRLPSCRT